MGFDYVKSGATASRLIKRFGQSGTLKKTTATGPSYDPEITTDSYALTFVVLQYDNKEIDGTLIRTGDKLAYISIEGLAVTPEPSDKMIVEGAEHSIISVSPLSPAGTVVFYEVQVRR